MMFTRNHKCFQSFPLWKDQTLPLIAIYVGPLSSLDIGAIVQLLVILDMHALCSTCYKPFYKLLKTETEGGLEFAGAVVLACGSDSSVAASLFNVMANDG